MRQVSDFKQIVLQVPHFTTKILHSDSIIKTASVQSITSGYLKSKSTKACHCQHSRESVCHVIHSNCRTLADSTQLGKMLMQLPWRWAINN